MPETISVRIPESELARIKEILKYEGKNKSALLREVLDLGIRGKKLAIALEKFRKKEVTAAKAAKIAEIPLTNFLDILRQEGLEFHYKVDELREEFEGLI